MIIVIVTCNHLINSSAQSLFVNGGFEEENICTEYKVNCAPEGWISNSNNFSNYFKGRHLAHSGSHCMGFEAGKTRNKYQRSHIRTQLLCALRKGKKYLISFYVRSHHDILDSVGIVFTSYDFLFEKRLSHKMLPDIFLKDTRNNLRRNDTTWQKVDIVYTATGTELYMAIGNFSRRDINYETGIPMEGRFFVYIDNMSMVPVDPMEKICKDWQYSKAAIYDFSHRHEYLQRYVRYYRNFNKLPVPPKPGSTTMTAIDTLIIPDVLFAFDKHELKEKTSVLLDSFCRRIVKLKIDSLVVEGHTDSIGSDEYNEKLSLDRSVTVRDYFIINCNINSGIIFNRGFGSSVPVADNSNPAGRQRNRRVEVLLYVRD